MYDYEKTSNIDKILSDLDSDGTDILDNCTSIEDEAELIDRDDDYYNDEVDNEEDFDRRWNPEY